MPLHQRHGDSPGGADDASNMLATEDARVATLTIRNLDEEVVERWKERARRHHRSLESEVRDYLGKGVAAFDRTAFEAWAREVAAMTPPGPQSDSGDLVREDRDR